MNWKCEFPVYKQRNRITNCLSQLPGYLFLFLFSKPTSYHKIQQKRRLSCYLDRVKSLGNHLGLIFWGDAVGLKITKCVQASEVGEYEEEAHITFAILDVVNGNIEDAMTAFESVKNVVSYWNLALVSRW